MIAFMRKSVKKTLIYAMQHITHTLCNNSHMYAIFPHIFTKAMCENFFLQNKSMGTNTRYVRYPFMAYDQLTLRIKNNSATVLFILNQHQ